MTASGPAPDCGITLRDSDRALVVAASGRWRLGATPDAADLTPRLDAARSLRLEAEADVDSDSSLPAYLLALLRRVQARAMPVELALPPQLRASLELAGRDRESADGREGDGKRPSPRLSGVRFIGELLLSLPRRATMQGRTRRAELLAIVRQCSSASLPIVALVNLLVGGILAFIGAVQLQRFGAEIFVADLVGIATTREMAALITAVVLAGRLGAAFAAEIATMQGNEEIDALRTIGVDPVRHLALPRVLALTLAMPFLYACACAVGLAGGLVVSVVILDLPTAAYVTQTREAVDFMQIGIGLSKSVAFAAFVGGAGCHYGLHAGRNAAAVGRAATQAVVTGIVGIICIDAVFAVLTNALGI